MKTLELQQGTPEWHHHRATARNASEAPVIMGCSPTGSRRELVRLRATGDEKEFSRYVEEVIFQNGHDVEAAARPIAEEIVGDDLFPVIGTTDDDYLSASFDGLTMDGKISWECKQWNKDKAALIDDGEMPPCDYWQVIQQLAVSGAEKALYMVTDGTRENCKTMWVERPNSAEVQTLIAAWQQFDEDVAIYQPDPESVQATSATMETLPALHVELTGMVTASNLDEFKGHALSVIESINTELSTDQDFADAENAVKWCKEVEQRLSAAKDHALSQTATIDQLFRTIDQISDEARKKRLDLDKLVKSRKQLIRDEILMQAKESLAEHIEKINATLGGKIILPQISADFAGAMKGKCTISSLRDAADTELARAKIEASQIGDRYKLNLETLRADAAGYEHLFVDARQIAGKENDDLKNLIATRISEHKAAEEKRLEAEREKTRAEEQAAAERRVQQEREAEQRERAKAETEQKAKADAEERAKQESADSQQEAEPAKTGRPTDANIVRAIAAAFGTDQATAITWLLDMDMGRLKKSAA